MAATGVECSSKNKSLPADAQLQSLLTRNVKLRVKLINMLESSLRDEPEYFWRDLARSNLLAYMYCLETDVGKAIEQLTETISRDSHNMSALVMLSKIHADDDNVEETTKIDETLQKIDSSDYERMIQTIICSSEVAYAYSYAHPSLYSRAITEYESLIAQYQRQSNTVREYFRDKLCGWYFHLAQTYSRMLNKGQLHQLLEMKNCTVTEVFKKITDRLKYVIVSEDTFYTGKAMILLVDAFKTCETADSNFKVPFPYPEVDQDEFVFRAMYKSPNDPYVLEKCGRQYRQRASTQKDFMEAVDILDRCTNLCETRHVAWHHKGLAYRALWHIAGEYEEARLYTNNSRKTKKKSARKQQTNRGNISKDSQLTVQPAEHSSSSSQASCTSVNDMQSSVVQPFKKSLSLKVDDPHPAVPCELPRSAPAHLPTLSPKFPTDPVAAPRQQRKPDYFDTLRVSNPSFKIKNVKSTEYLQNALNCFQKACEYTNKISARYLVDLGRTLISLGKRQEAGRAFGDASRVPHLDKNDESYLYEQWAILKEEEDNNGEMSLQAMTCVMIKYRKAIRAAIAARIRSKMSFYRLRDILRDLAKKNPENEAYRLEYTVLYETMEKYEKEIEALVEALKKDKDIVKVAEGLIELLYERSHQQDASIALLYISALQKAGKLNLSDNEKNQEWREKTVNLAARMFREDDGDPSILGEVYCWLVGCETLSARGFKVDTDDYIQDTYDVCILAPSQDTPGAEKMADLLKRYTTVCRAYWSGNCDALPGSLIYEGIYGLVGQSRSVLIFQDNRSDDWNMLLPVIDNILKIPTATVCLVAQDDRDTGRTESRYSERWPSFIMNDECNDACIVLSLLTRIIASPK